MDTPESPGRIVSVPIVRVDSGERKDTEDRVVVERPLAIYLNQREVITLLTSGAHPGDLAVGFLRSQGFITRLDKLGPVEFDEGSFSVSVATGEDIEEAWAKFHRRAVTSGAGKGTLFLHVLEKLRSKRLPPGFSVPASRLLELMEEIATFSTLHRDTGGVHSAGLASKEGFLLLRDDIGRHNAVDMIHGHCFLNSVGLHDKFLCSTGRLTSEMVIKAAVMGVPLLASLNPASSLAVETALAANLTLVGSARKRGMNIYTAPERVA